MPINTHKYPVALITGSAKRIGAAIAKGLHTEGYNVVVHYRDSKDAAIALTNELNQIRTNSAIAIQADLNQLESIQYLATTSIDKWQRLDLLINNASMFYPTPVNESTLDDWDALINSNLKSPYFLVQALVDSLKKQQGSIINIADIYAERPLKNHSIYCIAKAGNVMMTKSLAQELAPDIRVNGIAPGAILWPEENLTNTQHILDKIPLQKLGSTEEIINLVLFLAKKTNYITGQIISVDGGRSLNI